MGHQPIVHPPVRPKQSGHATFVKGPQHLRQRFSELCLRNAFGGARADRFAALERALLARSWAQTRLVWIGRDDSNWMDLSESARYELRPAP